VLRQKGTEVGVTRRRRGLLGGELGTDGGRGGACGAVGRHDVLEAGEVGAVRSKGVSVDARADDTGLRLNLELAGCLGGVDELELLRVLAVAARLEGMRVRLLQVGEAPWAGAAGYGPRGHAGTYANSRGRCVRTQDSHRLLGRVSQHKLGQHCLVRDDHGLGEVGVGEVGVGELDTAEGLDGWR